MVCNELINIDITPIDLQNRNKSIEMFHVYCAYYNLRTLEDMARAWNGGPRGADKMTTVGYFSLHWGSVLEN